MSFFSQIGQGIGTSGVVDIDGSNPKPLTEGVSERTLHRFVFPDGRFVIFHVCPFWQVCDPQNRIDGGASVAVNRLCFRYFPFDFA